VEIAMVATVIAILALLVLPLYRARVTEAKISAARDEVSSIAKSQLLAEADIGYHVRLQDLDNGRGADAVNTNNVHLLPPIAVWNGTLNGPSTPVVGMVNVNRDTVVKNWLGPYGALTSYAVVAELSDYWYNDSTGTGFINVVGGSGAFPSHPTAGGDNPDMDRYPVDPWDSPYAFFGQGRFPANDPLESEFNYSVIVSFGPNGVVADDADIATNPSAYRRYNPTDPSETGLIGDETLVTIDQSDDIIYRF